MGTGSRSRVYVSSAFETTAGTAATLNKTFRVSNCDIIAVEDQTPDNEVTGELAVTTHTRERLRSEGELAGSMHPDLLAWLFKMWSGVAPTSALVSPSSTVYEHTTQNMNTDPIMPFTLLKQHAAITSPDVMTERYTGVYCKTLNIRSGTGKVEVSAGLMGLGGHSEGVAEPSVNHNTEDYLVGQNTSLKIAGTALTAGILHCDWSITMDNGLEVIPTAGSTDKTLTRIDRGGLRAVTADVRIVVANRDILDDFLAETRSSFEFICTGPTIDAGNSLQSLVAIKLEKARILNPQMKVGDHGVFSMSFSLNANVDTSTSRDLTLRVRNLTASY